jgi:hypothetical protein
MEEWLASGVAENEIEEYVETYCCACHNVKLPEIEA